MKIAEPTYSNLLMTFYEVMELLTKPCEYSQVIDFSDEEWDRWCSRYEADSRNFSQFTLLETQVIKRGLKRFWASLVRDIPILYDERGRRVTMMVGREA